MTPLERLLAEELPTGTFGDAPRRAPRPARRQPAPARPPDTPPRRERPPITPLQAALNYRALEAALDELEGRGTGRPERHLHPVPDTPAA